MSKIEHFLGGRPLVVFVKLALISLIVGVVMAALNWTPFSFFETLITFVQDLWYLGVNSLGRLGNYFLLGAGVVIPIFLLTRLFGRK